MVPTLSLSSLSLVRHSYVFDTRVGVSFADGVFLIRRGVDRPLNNGSTTTTGTGSGLDLPSARGMTSSLSTVSARNTVENKIRVDVGFADFLLGEVLG